MKQKSIDILLRRVALLTRFVRLIPESVLNEIFDETNQREAHLIKTHLDPKLLDAWYEAKHGNRGFDA